MISYADASSIPCNVINGFSEEKIQELLNVIIDHYYSVGFPYYSKTSPKIEKEFRKLQKFNVSDLELDGNVLQQNMLGLSSANAFHPEMWEVQCRKSRTCMDAFLDRELFYKALRKRVKYSDTCLVDFNIRKSLKVFSGVQGVSNFRPTISKWVYDRFCPTGGKVLDPCAGYGGRLMGAMSSHIGNYIGIDPNWISQKGNTEFKDRLRCLGSEVCVELVTSPFEDYTSSEKYDLIFTSPPYFDIEKYSLDDNQSYKRYPKIDIWIEKFLKVLISNSFEYLVPGGYLVLNVGGKIVDDALRIGNSLMGTPTIYYMRLSKMFGHKDKGEISHKTEPIFIWKKN